MSHESSSGVRPGRSRERSISEGIHTGTLEAFHANLGTVASLTQRRRSVGMEIRQRV